MALGNMNIGVDSEFIPSNLNTVLTPPPTDSDEVVMNTSAAGYHRKPLSALWSWIKSKIASEVIPDVVTIQTSAITITTDWQDTGIHSTDLPSGTYIMQFRADTTPYCNIWGDIFCGVVQWYAEETNSGNADDIGLHCSGHSTNGQHFYLRTIRSGRSEGVGLRLQIKGSMAADTASTFTFKFRKLI